MRTHFVVLLLAFIGNPLWASTETYVCRANGIKTTAKLEIRGVSIHPFPYDECNYGPGDDQPTDCHPGGYAAALASINLFTQERSESFSFQIKASLETGNKPGSFWGGSSKGQFEIFLSPSGLGKVYPYKLDIKDQLNPNHMYNLICKI